MPETIYEYSYPFPLRITNEKTHKILVKIAEKEIRSMNFIINAAMDEYAENHKNELEGSKSK